MKKLYTPRNEVELAFIRSILAGEDIPFFVHNDHFGSLKIGPQIELFNAKTIMVREEDIAVASELVADWLQTLNVPPPVSSKGQSEYSVFDKVRMVLEVLLFTWIMPGRWWRLTRPDGEE